MTPLVLGCRARRTDKLGELDMVEDVDYLLRHVSEQVRKQGGTVISNSYILTPESFKFCLAQAQRSPRQAKAGCSWYGRVWIFSRSLESKSMPWLLGLVFGM